MLGLGIGPRVQRYALNKRPDLCPWNRCGRRLSPGRRAQHANSSHGEQAPTTKAPLFLIFWIFRDVNTVDGECQQKRGAVRSHRQEKATRLRKTVFLHFLMQIPKGKAKNEDFLLLISFLRITKST